MEVIIEEILVYGVVFFLCLGVVFLYMRKLKKKTKETERKVEIAKEEGLFEPVSLHPYINLNTCIGSAACVSECPEKDILGIANGKATLINSSNCVGHGACFHACPVEAISLRMGTESRGVDLPHVNQNFETNIRGIYIAGELGGMGLIRNSVEQGQQAIDSILKSKKPNPKGALDVIIIGAGPAGISATLACKKHKLSSVTLEQDSLGGTVYTFPRSKIVMTSPMNLPLHGKVKLYDTSKDELLKLWNKVIEEHDIEIREKHKVENIIPQKDDTFKVITTSGEEYIGNNVLISIGRRGSPRKLNIPGEESTKVAYRLLEPERISGKEIVVVGGGDSAIEASLLLMDENNVRQLVRTETLTRCKPKNREKITQANADGKVKLIFSSNLVSISDAKCIIKTDTDDEAIEVPNDLVYIFAGGILPTAFLEKPGIKITKRFGYIMKKHG
ncbi:MAG: NAD(P)-binding domain-containing protein [Bacteroidia bacterium]|nr:NAD(P)-binding domain-containing protein [Bacteroidia bacterium]NNJ81965.1 NAD(P)-binding domain-containing protein [Flavobacteriaceae bacterium]NNK54733.1 NAD(P)-binding domain-containing protein [Flavobacteriaceae bacterium]NNM09722.1 NAD(P)-binding domain-containing protein [Flavobacteriaceae bacterium]